MVSDPALSALEGAPSADVIRLDEAEGALRASLCIERLTATARPSICPEIKLRLAADMALLWEGMEAALGLLGMPPPYWGVAWPGGQALARYILDHPAVVAGHRVLDLGSGSGLCAIAAAKAGAAIATANDIAPLARLAIGRNAQLNDVVVEIEARDIIGQEGIRPDILLAADLWYEKHLADRVTPWLRQLAHEGTLVLVGDNRRMHFPRRHLLALADYMVAASDAQELAATVHAGVWQMTATESPKAPSDS
jgi:predicted nicotinamide N-methyase